MLAPSGEAPLADAAVTDEPIEAEPPAPPQPHRIAYRHRLPTRIWHWLNAITVIVMLMSGLMILNAHPRLYWGVYGANFDRAWLALPPRPFPGWATISSTYDLAAARRWHLAFAWVLVAGLVLRSEERRVGKERRSYRSGWAEQRNAQQRRADL